VVIAGEHCAQIVPALKISLVQQQESKVAMGKFMDLTGRVFGYLTVKKLSPEKGKGAIWICECVCGALVSKKAQRLKDGSVKSCGCKSKELMSQVHKNKRYSLQGLSSGFLTFIEECEPNEHLQRRAVFRCICGNLHTAMVNCVLVGRIKSCGCLARKLSAERGRRHMYEHTAERNDKGQVIKLRKEVK
jgi:hypothetical protein